MRIKKVMGQALMVSTLCGGLGLLDVAIGEEAQPSADDIAKQLANPNTPLATLNIKNQFRFFQGDLPDAGSQSSYTNLFQPSFPFDLSNGDLILWRPAVPFVVEQPIFNEGSLDFNGETGLGDIVFDLAYAQTTADGILWAAGLVSTVPTATSAVLGAGQWALGPEILLGKLTDRYVVGLFPNHQWDVAGWGDSAVNLTTIQLFATLLPGGGWNVGSAPIISYDWNAEQWTAPVNLTVGKTVILGSTPWKISAEANYYFERSGLFGAEWMFGINVAPVIKNPLSRLFGGG